MATFIDIEEQYAGLFARRAGFLPPKRKSLHSWHARLGKKAAASPDKKLSPSVAAMAKLIESDGIVRMYADQMIEQQALLLLVEHDHRLAVFHGHAADLDRSEGVFGVR